MEDNCNVHNGNDNVNNVKDFLSDLPIEVSLQILRYFDPKTLCKCALICKRWRALTDDDQLWKAHCKRNCKGKLTPPHLPLLSENGEPLLSPKANYSLVAQHMMAKELKVVLQRRDKRGAGSLLTGLVEKDEFVNAVKMTTPPSMLNLQLQPLYSKWKASYQAELVDSKRAHITWEEITSFCWLFSFKSRSFFHQGEQIIRAFFRKNYQWESDIGMNTWKFAGENMVQVGEYPPLKVSRNPEDWGFILTNEHVILKSRPLDF